MTFELIGDERFFASTFRLSCVGADGFSSTASCFAYQPGLVNFDFAVTAAHSIRAAKYITAHVPYGRSLNGSIRIDGISDCTPSANPFVCHPDQNVDIAVARLSDVLVDREGKVVTPFGKSASSEHLFEPTALTNLIRYLGFPENRFDDRLGVGVLRSGWSASPFTRSVNAADLPKLAVDGEFFEGNSGGPAFRYDQHVPTVANGFLAGSGTRLELLGVVVEASTNTFKDQREVPLAIGYVESIAHVDNCAKALSGTWGEHEDDLRELFSGWPPAESNSG
jgi:hypothetical protein